MCTFPQTNHLNTVFTAYSYIYLTQCVHTHKQHYCMQVFSVLFRLIPEVAVEVTLLSEQIVVPEDVGRFTVCVDLIGDNIDREAIVTFTTVNGDALG